MLRQAAKCCEMLRKICGFLQMVMVQVGNSRKGFSWRHRQMTKGRERCRACLIFKNAHLGVYWGVCTRESVAEAVAYCAV